MIPESNFLASRIGTIAVKDQSTDAACGQTTASRSEGVYLSADLCGGRLKLFSNNGLYRYNIPITLDKEPKIRSTNW